MSFCIFLGPTLDVESARGVLDADYLPPAAQSDIYRATLRQPPPRAIGLIDGSFRQGPAVRHKEILWAMAQGIHVFGAASMGALRAAELAEFGMVGVGQIFQALQDGALEDDDEVAVEHGPAELGYLPLNEAMVDIRATLAAAVADGVIDLSTATALTGRAKSLFYPERTYANIIGDRNALRQWLPANRRSQKRDDAMAMLAAIRDFVAADPPPKQVSYNFERTEMWDTEIAFATPLGTVSPTEILDELRLDPETCKAVRQEALTRALSLREFKRQGVQLTPEEISAAEQRWSRERNLHFPEDILDWRRDNQLDDAAFNAMILEEAMQSRLEQMAQSLIDENMLPALRAHGSYPAIASRAAKKQEALTILGATPSMSTFDLVTWYCQIKLNCPPPAVIEEFALRLGFDNCAEFHHAALREFRYWQLKG